MRRETIFPKGLKLYHAEVNRVVNVYKSSRNTHGIQYGHARPVDQPLHRASCLYRVRIIWK